MILDACDWRQTDFAKFQALPKGGNPIAKWNNRHEAWLDVIKGIRTLVSSDMKISTNIPHGKAIARDLSNPQKRNCEANDCTIVTVGSGNIEYILKNDGKVKNGRKQKLRNILN